MDQFTVGTEQSCSLTITAESRSAKYFYFSRLCVKPFSASVMWHIYKTGRMRKQEGSWLHRPTSHQANPFGVFGDRAASLSDVGFAEIRSALFLWAIGTKQKSAERNKSAHTGNKELLSKRQSTTACKHSSFSLTAFTGHAPKTSTGNETFVRCLASLAPVCVCGVCFSLREPVHRTLIYS